jgi:hypothetical protein
MKKIMDDARCDICNVREETTQHILFECPFARSFWAALGFQLPAGLCAQQLHLLPRPDIVPAEHYDALILLYCWQLWKRRNGAIFRQELLPLRQVIRLCKEDATL